MKWSRLWRGALLVCLCGLAVQADTWTNRAGHVLTARLVGLQGTQVLLQGTNGRVRRVPLASLRPADQERVREQTGTEPLPSELQAPLEQAQAGVLRAAQLLQTGRITREEYSAQCREIKLRLERLGKQALEARGEVSRRTLLNRLDRQLDRAEQNYPQSLPPPRKPDAVD